MREGVPNSERILTKNEIIEGIKSSGFNEELRQEIIRWRSWMEVVVGDERDRLSLEVDMLEFYTLSGVTEEENENALQVYYFARATPGCDDLAEKILKLYPECNRVIAVSDVLGTQGED